MRARCVHLLALALVAASALDCAEQGWRRQPPAIPEDMRLAFPTLECARVTGGPQICVVELPNSPVVALGLSLAVGARRDPGGAPGAVEATLAAILDAHDEHGVPVLEAALGELGGPMHSAVTADGALLGTYTVPAHLQPALRILTDVVMTPVLTTPATEAARTAQCQSATEALGDPGTLARLAVRRALLPRQHPGTQPALRTQICHESLETARAVELSRRLLVPDNVAVIVAGPVVTDDVVLFIQQLTAAWRPATTPEPPLPEFEPRAAATTIVDVPGLAQTVIAIGALTQRGHPADDPELALALAYARSDVEDGLRGDLGATYSVSSELVAAGDRAVWLLAAQVDAAATARALDELTSRLRFLGERPVDDVDVFTSGVHMLVVAMRSFAVAVDGVRVLAERHRSGAPIAQAIERARDLRAVGAEGVSRLLNEAFAPRAAQLVLVGDARTLTRIGALRSARVVRPISVLDG